MYINLHIVQFRLSLDCSMNFDKSIVMHPPWLQWRATLSVLQNSLLLAPYSQLISPSQLLATTDLFSFSIVLPFSQYHVNRLVKWNDIVKKICSLLSLGFFHLAECTWDSFILLCAYYVYIDCFLYCWTESIPVNGCDNLSMYALKDSEAASILW